ncbi:MAG: NosD domain-containing protein [Candidatus Thermoplasmatota archaeon]
MKRGILCIVICMLMILASAVPISATRDSKMISQLLADGNILYVGGTGPNNYTKIQDAINDASDDDMVFVYSGTYYENLMIEKSIKLIGETKNTTIVDGHEQDDADVILIMAEKVTVQGFTIQNANINSNYPDYNNGIEVWSNNNTIRDNIIRNSTMGIQLGEEVKYQGHENNHSHFNMIEGNDIVNNGFAGIYIITSVENIVVGNSISENKYHGVFLIIGSQSQIQQNIISDHSGVGVWVNGGSNITIMGNHIVGNGEGIAISHSSLNTIIQNNIYQNRYNAAIYSDLPNFILGKILHQDKELSHSWNGNYWGRPYLGPKLIVYRMLLLVPTIITLRLSDFLNLEQPVTFQLPIPLFDWHPAQEPYDIPGIT